MIKLHNRWESEMAGVAMSAAEGRNYFTQLAPCANNRPMFGKSEDGVAEATDDSEFNYTFTCKMKPTTVPIRLYRHAPSATKWVLVELGAT